MFRLKEIVARALEEDIGTGDITTESLADPERQASAEIIAKEPGVIAGLDVARLVFTTLDAAVEFTPTLADGDRAAAGQVVARVKGTARTILTGERVALNFLQRLSGIATATAAAVELLQYYPAKVMDTRKTTPGLRMLEKYAVRVAGGFNHRFGLYDSVLIKENHIKLAGSIKDAVAGVRRHVSPTSKIEVEVEALAQIPDALEAHVDIIMLDNFAAEDMRKAVQMIDGRAKVEASGGITQERLTEVAKAGVDYISMGSLTHSVKALDLSLELDT
ncbi:MAG: carboxylating nicotinate-nucleotide diphosphorylase [Bacillota bacterium]